MTEFPGRTEKRAQPGRAINDGRGAPQLIHIPPGLSKPQIVSRYWTMLRAVSRKKHVTHTSQLPVSQQKHLGQKVATEKLIGGEAHSPGASPYSSKKSPAANEKSPLVSSGPSAISLGATSGIQLGTSRSSLLRMLEKEWRYG